MELHRPDPLIPVGTPAEARADAPLAPPIRRTPMAARPWRGLSLLSWLFRVEPGPPDVDGPARGAGQRRRFVLLALSLAPAVYATYVMSGLLPQEASSPAEMALLAVFAILSCWLAAGFWTAMMGFVVLLRGGDRHLISRAAVQPGPLPAAARTAVVMPICNEDVKRVFAGLRATIESVARADALAELRFLHPVGQQRAGHLRGRTRRLACAARDAERPVQHRRAAVLSPPRTPREAQEREHRRLLPALGRAVSLHGGARRRQRDERAVPGHPGAADGSAARCRNHPDGAERGRSRHTARAHPAVRQPGLRAALHRRPALLATGRIALLGAQRDHPPRALHEALRAGAPARSRRARRRDPVPRLRRGGADAACRVRRVDCLRPAGQLRGNAVEPDRGSRSRPSLVPRQPDERAPDVRPRHASGAPHRVPDRRAGVPVGTSMGGLPRAVDLAAGCPRERRARVLRDSAPALSVVAIVESAGRARAVRRRGVDAVRPQAAGRPDRRRPRRAGRMAGRCGSPPASSWKSS